MWKARVLKPGGNQDSTRDLNVGMQVQRLDRGAMRMWIWSILRSVGASYGGGPGEANILWHSPSKVRSECVLECMLLRYAPVMRA